ncbi:MAG: hypothetical protein M1820_004015 [Bogoriella megaspora]|nr:MAG: hypothetical protein M1820_004015 [Bogoriella megaspora]
MDPVSLVVGVVPLIELVLRTSLLTRAFVNEAKDAKESISVLITELNALHSNLERLKQNIDSENARSIVYPQASVLCSSTSACQVRVQGLHDKLEKAANNRVRQWLWPFDEKEHRKVIQDLRAFAQWMQFGLTIDGCAMLSRTSKDMLEILQRQLDTFQEIQSLGKRTAALEDAVQTHTRALANDRELGERHKILSWISDIQHDQRHHDIRSSRVEDTGGWLLECTEYLRWRDDITCPNVLWCHGIQGSGKSMLASLVIDKLLLSSVETQCPVAYMYFDYRDPETPNSSTLTLSILKQILACLPRMPASVIDICQKSQKQQRRFTQSEAERLIISVAQGLPMVYLVVDALDECEEGKHRMGFLGTMHRLRKVPNIRLIVTSRPHPSDIKNAFQNDPRILIEAKDTDIRLFIYREIARSDVSDLLEEDRGLAQNVIQTIEARAHGMFLLAVLQIQSILKEPTAGGMEEALSNLYQTLPDAFGGTIDRIERLPDSRRLIGISSLMWICHARPLTVPELSEVLAVEIGQKTTRPRHRPPAKVILQCCQGLVTIDDGSSTVRFVHYTVQEYLQAHSDQYFPLAQRLISATCLTYLLFDEFCRGPCDDDWAIESRVENAPFIVYASRHFGIHAAPLEQDPMVNPLLQQFLNTPEAIASCSQIHRWSQEYRYEYWKPEESNSITPLHISCHHGFQESARDLLSRYPQSINVKTRMGTTPLILASSWDNQDIVRVLLDNGGDPYLANWYGNSLHCAAEAGSSDCIQELIDFGMDPDTLTGYAKTPLHCTTDYDRASAAKVLVDNGANLDARDADGGSILHRACFMGAQDVLEMALATGALDIDCTSWDGDTPLHCAVYTGNSTIVETILEAGANPNMENLDKRTPLDHAIDRGRGDLGDLLLSYGAVVAEEREYVLSGDAEILPDRTK